MVDRPKQRLRRRIRWSLLILLMPLTLAGAAAGLVLIDVVEGFKSVAREQGEELVPMGPLEADIRRYENAAYNAFHTNYQRELKLQAPALEREVRALRAAVDDPAEKRELRAMTVELAAAARVLRQKLAEPWPQRADTSAGDPLSEFAAALNRAVDALHAAQQSALAESEAEVHAADALKRKLVWALLLLGVLTLGAALLLARSLGRYVLSPLGRLEAASRRIGAGDLEHRLRFERADEFGVVGAAFDTMVEQIEQGRRELEVTQDRLHQSQKLEAVGQLAGGIAHDFNNLLLVVRGYTTFVADNLPAGDARLADLGVALDAIDRLANLTRQLLTFSRRETATPTVVDVNACVADLQTMLDSLTPSRIAIEVDLDPETATTTIDPTQLEQVIVNLVLNARDAIHGSGRIAVSTRNLTLDGDDAHLRSGLAPGAYVSISVQDNGSGMPEEIAARIFEPFYTTKPRGSGTGLGLAVTHGIIEQAGGHIAVSTDEGVGSTFTVYLPASTEPADADAAAPASAPSLQGATVLVAEDERPVRTLIERVLAQAGIETIAADSAEEALLLAQSRDGAFDLLLTDLSMPGKSGPTLAEELTSSYGPVPVIFMSGYNDTVHTDGDATFLQKPFTRDSLLQAISEQLPSRRRRDRRSRSRRRERDALAEHGALPGQGAKDAAYSA